MMKVNELENFQLEVQWQVDELISVVAKLNFVVVTTADGFEVAASEGSKFTREDVSKLAAMSSSIAAIGGMAVREISNSEECESILIDGSESYILILGVPHPKKSLIMGLVASHDAVLGQILYQAKLAAAEICKL
jgi:Uncharacterized distant relative of homeotic protein bithoraxoid